MRDRMTRPHSCRLYRMATSRQLLGAVKFRKELFDQRPGEFGIVDMKRQPADQAAGTGQHGRFQLVEERRVGLRVVKRLTGRIERGDALSPGSRFGKGLTARLSLSAIQRAQSRFSSAVVRISVTYAL